MHDPLGKIAYVDELDRIILRSRHEHLAASIKPRGPVGEPTRWVLWTHNQSGPANKCVLTYRLLARDLGGTIGLLAAVLDLRCRGHPEWSGISPLPDRSVVGIYADRRDKGPMRDAMLERRDSATHLAGMTRHINDGIELLAGKRREAVRFVAVHTDEASAVRNCSGDASCGARHVMAHRVGVGGNGAPEKLRAAKDQQAHFHLISFLSRNGFQESASLLALSKCPFSRSLPTDLKYSQRNDASGNWYTCSFGAHKPNFLAEINADRMAGLRSRTSSGHPDDAVRVLMLSERL